MKPQRFFSRRDFLSHSAQVTRALGVALFGSSFAPRVSLAAGADDFGDLLDPDPNGLRLPAGFSSRIVATTGQPVASTGHTWHAAPDGGATFATAEGGWIYVSNAEIAGGEGGVGAIRFAANGAITEAYTILSGTQRNCAGGPTPWNTWLSCEEVSRGRVFECDPFSPGSQGTVRPALGIFRHEAAAVDPVHETIYLTEDQPDGLLYRFSPSEYPSLSKGRLEAAEILDPDGLGPIVPGQTRRLAWHAVADPSAATTPTRMQVPPASPFFSGEGCAYHAGKVFFTTKGDNRVWQIDTETNQIGILYDYETAPSKTLYNPDNVFAATSGDVYVAEDPGNLEIVALTPSGQVKPIMRLTGQSGTEITGPALSPDGTRLYFSSQRDPGTTYEVTGPFLASSVAVPFLGELERTLLALGTGVVGTAGGLLLSQRASDIPARRWIQS